MAARAQALQIRPVEPQRIIQPAERNDVIDLPRRFDHADSQARPAERLLCPHDAPELIPGGIVAAISGVAVRSGSVSRTVAVRDQLAAAGGCAGAERSSWYNGPQNPPRDAGGEQQTTDRAAFCYGFLAARLTCEVV